LAAAPLCAQQVGHPELAREQKQQVDGVLPANAAAEPKQPRKVLSNDPEMLRHFLAGIPYAPGDLKAGK